MAILVKLFGIAIVVMGIIFLINPKVLRQYVTFWKQRKRLYMGGILALLIGIIFLLAASQCRLAGIIIIFGILSILKGVFYFAVGQKKLDSMLNWWQKRSLPAVRLYAIIIVALGALLIYSV